MQIIWADVTSGIPRGSVIRPMLFICYINDMPSSVLSSIYLFADDANLYRNIASDDDPSHSSTTFINWRNGQRNGSCVSSKCKVMHLGRQKTHRNYTLGAKTLATTTSEKNLGVNFDTKLTFEKHIETVVYQANTNARTHPSLVVPRKPVTAEIVHQSCQADARVCKCSYAAN